MVLGDIVIKCTGDKIDADAAWCAAGWLASRPMRWAGRFSIGRAAAAAAAAVALAVSFAEWRQIDRSACLDDTTPIAEAASAAILGSAVDTLPPKHGLWPVLTRDSALP